MGTKVPDITKKLKVKVGTKHDITLLPSWYVTSGGEGAIYKNQGIVYKVYIDGKDHDYMEEKCHLLGKFKLYGGIVAPEDVLFYADGTVAGYTMNEVLGDPLVKYFTNDTWKKLNLDHRRVTDIVRQMQGIVKQAHFQHALMVDGNEMNYLIQPLSGPGFAACVIDVDSWQIGQFKATAIMASIQDHHTQGFSTDSDWFSWAVVTFQLYTGIHPFKGKHPDFKANDFVERMKKNVSVFDPNVHVPAIVRNFGEIPKGLFKWYEGMFTSSHREAPPDVYDTPFAAVSPKVKTTYGSTSKIVYVKLRTMPEEVVLVTQSGHVWTNVALYDKLGKEVNRVSYSLTHGVGDVITTKKGPVAIQNHASAIVLGNPLKSVMTAVSLDRFFTKDNRLFALHEQGLTEIEVYDAVNSTSHFRGLPGTTWSFHNRSSVVGDGVIIYDALGSKFLITPVGEKGCTMSRTPFLDGKTVIEAKSISNFVECLVKDKQGDTYKYSCWFDDYGVGKTEWTEKTDLTELNFTFKPDKEIVVSIEQDGELRLFHPRSAKGTVISDKTISTEMKLSYMSGQVVFSRDNEIWSLSMK
jgi:hypothetical protein